MEDNSYQVYKRSVLNLAATIVIKCHDSAQLLNRYIDTFFGENLYDPYDLSTWKYYKNLTGQYYSTDTMMTVRSSDTLEEIDFTIPNLEVHRNTALDYRYGTKAYKELVSRYPYQVQLILGILYPVDMQTLISAPNHSIVSYAPEHVEKDEFQLIGQLNQFVQEFFSRYLIDGFKRTDELYLASIYAVLYPILPSVIMVLRVAAHKTRFAHSYHVRQYLSSHSKMGPYIDYMTRTQTMFAYKNIDYIEKNSGNQFILDILIRRFLTQRNIPIAKFDMRHDVSKLPEQLTAELYFHKEPLNSNGNIDGVDRYTLSDLMDVEQKVDPPNKVNRELHYENIDTALTYATQNEMPTKVFESTVLDYSESEKNRWTNIAFNAWAWLSHKGYYTAYVTFQIPSNGNTITISAKDAFTLYVYCLINSLGYVINDLPTFMVTKVPRIPAVNKAALRRVCGERVEEFWTDALFATMPRVRRCISVQAFNQYATELFIAANAQWDIAAQNEALVQRGQLENAGLQMWSDEVFYLGDHEDQLYAHWFASRNLSMAEYTEQKLAEIAEIILIKVTGIELNDKTSMKNIQKAMVGLLTNLSSYSIQIGTSINAGPILNAGILQLRTDDYHALIHSLFALKVAILYFSDLKALPHHHLWCDLDDKTYEQSVSVKTSTYIFHEIPVIPAREGEGKYTKNLITFSTKLQLNVGLNCWAEVEPLPAGLPPTCNVPGLAQWYSMPEQYRLSARSAWQADI